jgi:purine-binding chemotaxis protein CheW
MLALLTFEVAERRYALPAEFLLEVVRAVTIAPLPKAPSIIEGVINYRGTLVPVVGVRRRLDLDSIPLSPEQHLLIVQAGPRTVALRVDQALDLVMVPKDVVERADKIAPGAEYVAGLARLPDGLLIIQDLKRFLSMDEARQLAAAMSEATA